MTVQTTDTFKYKNKKYDFIQIDNNELPFNPEDYGFDTYGTSSCCWRGYECIYAIKNNKLIIKSLMINSNNKVDLDNKKSLFKLPFNKSFRNSMLEDDFNYKYSNINLEIQYSGSMFIGRGHIYNDFDDNYYDMNYLTSPHSYKEVIKLNFYRGRLVFATDVSDQLDLYRNELRKQYKEKPQYEEKIPELKMYEDFIGE